MFAGGIVDRSLEAADDVFGVGDIVQVQFFQQVQLQHGGYHVVGGLDKVVLRAAGLDLGQQFFVIGKNVVIYFTVVLLFKFGNDLRIEVVCPAEQVQHLFFAACGSSCVFFGSVTAAASQGQCENSDEENQKFFHCRITLSSVDLLFILYHNGCDINRSFCRRCAAAAGSAR
jgi:hypothetical protein